MEERGLEKTKVLVRLRPFTWNERKRGAEKWPTAVTICPKATPKSTPLAKNKREEGYDVLLGYEPAYSSHEPPSSVGRQLAARVASFMNLSASPEPESAENPTMMMQTPPPIDSKAEANENNDVVITSRKVVEGTPEYWEDLLTPTTGGTTATAAVSSAVVTPVNQISVPRSASKDVLREIGGNDSNTPGQWPIASGQTGGGGPNSAMKTPSAKHANNLPSKFTFDHVYGPEVATHELYDTGGVGEIVNSMLNGYNGTIMCYGQTGSGKTYTMEGIVNLAIDDIFSFVEGAPADEKFLLSASILEVYNERVTDLLVSSTNASESNLKLLDVPSRKGVAATTVVQGLSSVKVDSKDTLMNALQTAKLNRMTASTKINEKSSRSHLVIKLNLERIFQSDTKGRMIQASCLNLVDLAGSERLQESQTTGLRMKESCAINQSLLCLGNVVSRLAEGSSGHIPYRDSKLTRLLQHALGGNSKTAMICTVSPAGGWHLEQTRSTLVFASRAMNISNKTMRNIEAERNNEMSSLLLKYEKEIEALRLQIRDMESQGKEKEDDKEEHVAHLQRKIDNLTKFILNDQRYNLQTPSSVGVGRFDLEHESKSGSSKDPSQELMLNRAGRNNDYNRLYTTLGLVSPTVEGGKNSPSSYDNNKNFLVSPLMEQLEKYKDQRKRHQSDLSASIEETKKCHDTILRLQEDVASLKDERERDQILLRKQMQEIQHELDDYEKENIKLQTNSEKLQALLAQRDATIKHTQDDVIRLEVSTASKDALLGKHSKIINEMKQEMSDLLQNKQNQAREIKNLKALNQRLCREAKETKETNRKGLEEKQEKINSLIMDLQGLERDQRESDVEARKAEESALELCSQISALEGTLDRVGSKAALVSPANRRVKELEEILSIKNAQLRDVEDKIDSMNVKPLAQNEDKMGKRKFDAQKLRRFALRLDTALIKIQNCTINAETSPMSQPGLSSSRSDNSPVLPDRPIDSACITWQDYRTFSGNKENQSPRTPENMQIDKSMFQVSVVKKHELKNCICDAIHFSKLFKNEIELLYASLQEAEEANDGQQVLLTVVAQEHAKKTSDLENEIARLKSGLKDSALEDQASRGSIHTLQMSIAEYEKANLQLNTQMKQCKQQLQSCTASLQSSSDELKVHKSLVKEKESVISQKEFVIAELKISEDEKENKLQSAFSELEGYKSALEQKSAEIDNLNSDIAEKVGLLAQRESKLLEFGEQQGNEKNIIQQLKGDQKDLLKTVGQLKLDLHKRDELLGARIEELASVELKLESLQAELQTLNSTNEVTLRSKTVDVEKLRVLNMELMKKLRLQETQNLEKDGQLKEKIDGNAELAKGIGNLTRERDALEVQNLAQEEKLAAVEREIKEQGKLLVDKDMFIFQCQEMNNELKMEFDNRVKEVAGIKDELASLGLEFDTKLEECTRLQSALEHEKAKVKQFGDELLDVQEKFQVESQTLASEKDRRLELECEISKERDTIAQKHQESTRLVKECDFLKDTCKNTDEKLESTTRAFAESQSGLLAARRALEHLESLGKSIQEEKDGLEGSLRSKDEMVGELQAMIDEKNAEVEMIQSNVEALENKIAEMTNLSEQYSSHMVTQNKCLEENHKQLQELQHQVATAQDDLTCKDDKIAHLELELEGKALEHGHYESLLERIEMYEEELEANKAIQQEMDEENQRYKNRLDAFSEVDEINLNFGHVQSTTNILGVLDFSDEDHSPQMLRIMKLWKELCVPLYHRSRFYGTKSNSLIRNNVAILALELNRLQWIKESMSAGTSYLPRAKADLSRERNELMLNLRKMPKSVRDAMFTAWGYSRDDRKRKQRIISGLWDADAPPSKSSTIVLLLNEGCLDRKTCFLHFCSLYAMHHFSETDLQEGHESPIPVIPIKYDSDDGEDDGEICHGSPLRKKNQTALSRVFTPLLKLTGGRRKRDE
jgi:chromosome segregation ATPase